MRRFLLNRYWAIYACTLASTLIIIDGTSSAVETPTVDLAITTAIEAGDWDRARALAWEHVLTDRTPEKSAMELWYRTHSEDPAFLPPEILTLKHREHFRSLVLISKQGTSFIYRVKKGRKTLGAFKPEHNISLSNHRGEIAAYRLCALIHCRFKVPHNEEARIRKTSFLKHRTHDLEWEAVREEKKIRVVYQKDKDRKRWIYGTLKEWVPGYSQFPIETVDFWKPHLQIAGTPLEAIRSTPLKTLVRPMRKSHRRRYNKFVYRMKGVSSEDFLRQLSNLHVFDVLISNWDRYANDIPGLNCQWNHGLFVSIDNGASFPTSHRKKRDRWPLERLRRHVQRFSRSTIQAIRWMDTKKLRPILFPPSPTSDDDKARYALLLDRREAVLDYVDALIAEHGEENVLVFE